MDLQIDKVILHTKSISGLSQFVTQLFELPVEVDQFGKSFCDFGNIKVYFEESFSNVSIVPSKHKDTNFVFKILNVEELEAFKLKLEFYYYREAIEYKLKIERTANTHELKFIDPDGRTWLLESPMVDQKIDQKIDQKHDQKHANQFNQHSHQNHLSQFQI